MLSGSKFTTVAASVLADLKPEIIMADEADEADEAYDSDKIREEIAAFGGTACIKPRRNRKVVIPFNKEHHNVECFFQELKRYRRIATRYDKLAVRFLAFIHVACILVRLL